MSPNFFAYLHCIPLNLELKFAAQKMHDKEKYKMKVERKCIL